MMNIKNLSVNNKIALAFSCIAVAVIALSMLFISGLNNTRDNILTLTDEVLPNVLLVEKIKFVTIFIRRDQFSFLPSIGDPEMKSWMQTTDNMIDDVTDMINTYEKSIQTEEERQALTLARRNWQDYLSAQSGFNDIVLQNDLAGANTYLLSSYKQFNRMQDALTKLTEINLARTETDRTNTLEGVSTATMKTYIGVGALFTLMAVMTLFLGRQIRNPLREVMTMAEEIANGNLAYQIKRDQIGNDELGQLADSCISMQKNLRELVDEIGGAVVQLSSSIEEVSAISEQSSQGMSQQQNEITMVATAMQQMQATVNEVAMNTEDASSSANSATERADQGNQEVQQNIIEIQQVSEVIENAGEMVAQLEKDSASISMVVDVIGGIAEQTNLLALNAAIEAARAGEQGRGFAVVADEVRTLAGRTQDSTRQIVEIIEKLQLRAVEAGAATKQSCEMIRGCVSQTHSTGEKISEIEQAVTQIAAMNIQIASACSEQNSVTEDLSRSVETINVSSSEAATGAGQTAQACIELSQLSLGLKSMVDQFKTA
ncbi:methyl-accepting chemotaxis protein [Shewanella sediminis HAW-EB3]|uniref:Methyl-accepting chemotaxis protein n=1 Tax=Shewanella sediminis (strain HAW-EB3) TaxID=425104 RepID=A8FYB7_SHESH|nr:methyl-accepting chemotaxis protein [Shewanella sediminis]ABV37840.1 methyl-accepting chemotaxis protein [Shewanella sediminis HAW-EB3]